MNVDQPSNVDEELINALHEQMVFEKTGIKPKILG